MTSKDIKKAISAGVNKPFKIVDRTLKRHEKQFSRHERNTVGSIKDDDSYEQTHHALSDRYEQDVDKNYENLLKAIEECTEHMGNRLGYKFTEGEVAMRFLSLVIGEARDLIERIEYYKRGRGLHPDTDREESMKDLTAASHGHMKNAKRLIKKYNLDELGFEHDAISLALVTDQEDLASKYVNSSGKERKKAGKEIEENALNFVQKKEEEMNQIEDKLNDLSGHLISKRTLDEKFQH